MTTSRKFVSVPMLVVLCAALFWLIPAEAKKKQFVSSYSFCVEMNSPQPTPFEAAQERTEIVLRPGFMSEYSYLVPMNRVLTLEKGKILGWAVRPPKYPARLTEVRVPLPINRFVPENPYAVSPSRRRAPSAKGVQFRILIGYMDSLTLLGNPTIVKSVDVTVTRDVLGPMVKFPDDFLAYGGDTGIVVERFGLFVGLEFVSPGKSKIAADGSNLYYSGWDYYTSPYDKLKRGWNGLDEQPKCFENGEWFDFRSTLPVVCTFEVPSTVSQNSNSEEK